MSMCTKSSNPVQSQFVTGGDHKENNDNIYTSHLPNAPMVDIDSMQVDYSMCICVDMLIYHLD